MAIGMMWCMSLHTVSVYTDNAMVCVCILCLYIQIMIWCMSLHIVSVYTDNDISDMCTNLNDV